LHSFANMSIAGWKRALTIGLVVNLLGCGPSTQDAHTDKTELPTVNTDLELLRKFVPVPDSAFRAGWQTGKQPSGNDWWLAAYIEYSGGSMPDYLPAVTTPEMFTLPKEFSFEPPFDQLEQLAKMSDADSEQPTFLAETLSTKPFEDAPLLDGIAVKMNDSSVFIYLFTK